MDLNFIFYPSHSKIKEIIIQRHSAQAPMSKQALFVAHKVVLCVSETPCKIKLAKSINSSLYLMTGAQCSLLQVHNLSDIISKFRIILMHVLVLA
jgi:hypothetical protein